MHLFAREAQTLFRYEWFASTAQFENCKEAAVMFNRLVQNQSVIVHGHLDLLRNLCDPVSRLPIGSTADNLASALAAEEQEGTTLYSSVASLADAEGLVAVASWLRTLANSKRESAARIRAVHSLMESNEVS
jgi:rubrerythrin